MKKGLTYYHVNKFIKDKKRCYNLCSKIDKPSDVLQVFKKESFSTLLYYRLNGFDEIVSNIWDHLKRESDILAFLEMDRVLGNEEGNRKEVIINFLVNTHYGGSCTIKEAIELGRSYNIKIENSDGCYITRDKKLANEYWLRVFFNKDKVE